MFATSKEPVYCKQDVFWNKTDIKFAAKKPAELSQLESGKKTFEEKDKKTEIVGDLMLSLDKSTQPSEGLSIAKYYGDNNGQVL